ncbi:MAG: hypothetical protein AB7L76_11940 [Burkholderiaceae bacterium]
MLRWVLGVRLVFERTAIRSILSTACCLPLAAAAQGYLENPVAGQVESGIGLVSGWHCTAKEVRVYIDGVDVGRSGVGSVRNDTASICGHANTGFSVLYNYNKLTPGPHSVAVYADGAHLETRQFGSVRSGGVPFLEGADQSVNVHDFPQPGTITRLRWSQAKQSFVVEQAMEDDSAALVSELLSRSFSGTVYRPAGPVGGDPTLFSFEMMNSHLRLTRVSSIAGTCSFAGPYAARLRNISWSGGYYCHDDLSLGTFAATIQADGSGGFYAASFQLTPTDGAGYLEAHTGCDHSYEAQP